MNVPKILLVDEVPLWLEVQKGFLLHAHVRVLTARTCGKALVIARKEYPDLVIIDHHLPAMDGPTCCKAFKGDPALSGIPVIITSNTVGKNQVEAFFRAGCDDYLEKSLDGTDFLEKVRRLVPSIKRRSVRVPCRFPVTGRIGNEVLAGTTEDLSPHGMYLACRYPATKGAPLLLSFSLPGEDARILVQGTVAWINTQEDRHIPALHPGFGVEFIRITGEGLAPLREKELREYLEKHTQSF
jgi:CheY-like chemotaxis protein